MSVIVRTTIPAPDLRVLNPVNQPRRSRSKRVWVVFIGLFIHTGSFARQLLIFQQDHFSTHGDRWMTGRDNSLKQFAVIDVLDDNQIATMASCRGNRG